MADLYAADEQDMADGLVSNGSRGVADEEGGVPPPYMPGSQAGASGSRTSLGRFGKDGEFPGLR